MKAIIEALQQNTQITSIKLPNKAPFKGPGKSAGKAEEITKTNEKHSKILFAAAKDGNINDVIKEIAWICQHKKKMYHITNPKGQTVMEIAKKAKNDTIVKYLKSQVHLRLPPFPTGFAHI